MSFKFTDYIFTPRDFVLGILHLKRKATWKDWGMVVFLISTFLLSYLYLQWQIDSSLIFIFLLAIFLWNLDSRISIVFALACLVIVPFLLSLDEKLILSNFKDWTERFAVWAYYFLVIGVLKQAWDFRRSDSAIDDKNIPFKTLPEEIVSQEKQQLEEASKETGFENRISIDESIGELEKKNEAMSEKKIRKVIEIIPVREKK